MKINRFADAPDVLQLSSDTADPPAEAVVQRLREQLRATDEVVEELHTRNVQLEQQSKYLAEQLAAAGVDVDGKAITHSDAGSNRTAELEAELAAQRKEIAALRQKVEAKSQGLAPADGPASSKSRYRELAKRCDELLLNQQEIRGAVDGNQQLASAFQERLGICREEIELESGNPYFCSAISSAGPLLTCLMRFYS
eukprot:SAG31_NODE_5939_length_2249_cov_1.644186_2_plen_197_part_00